MSIMRLLGLMISVSLCFGSTAFAWTEKALESSDPSTFAPNSLSTDFYSLGTKLSWSWVPGSFEWVRVDHRFLIPRARVKIEVPLGTSVRYQGKLILSKGTSVQVLVILSQEEKNKLEINQISVPILYRPAKPLEDSLVLDTSCSATSIRLSDFHLNHSWAVVYCHYLHPIAQSSHTSQLDVQLVWEGEGPKTSVSMNEIKAPSEDGLTYETSLNSESPALNFKRGVDSFSLSQNLSPIFHALGFSAGLGPYLNQNSWGPFATIYASYYFNEQMKLASFGALPIRANPEVDLGLYLINEQFRGFDERLIVNLLLGAHALSFQNAGTRSFRFSAPQGIEANFRDIFGRNRNLTFGGFFYPVIGDRSYLNTWIRYGNPALFLELNYIHWQEPVTIGSYESRSFGVSLGVPLFRAL